MRIFFVIFCLLLFSSCGDSIDQDVSNKPIYNISVGDTVKIYQTSTGGLEFSYGLNMDSLKHLEYIGVQNISSQGPPGCAGCSSTFAYVMVGKSSGTDTIFDELQGSVRPDMDTLTSYSHIIHVQL